MTLSFMLDITQIHPYSEKCMRVSKSSPLELIESKFIHNSSPRPPNLQCVLQKWHVHQDMNPQPAERLMSWLQKVVLYILTKTQEKWHPPQPSSPADAACQSNCGFSRWEDNKSTFFMRRQLEGMGNLRKRESRCWRPCPKTVCEKNPVGPARCAVQRKRSKRRGERQQLEWWDVFVKWRVALVDSSH